MDRAFLDAGIVYVGWGSLAAGLLTATTVRRPFVIEPLRLPDPPLLGATLLVTGLFAYFSTPAAGDGAFAATAIALLVATAIGVLLPQLTVAGVVRMTMLPLAWLFGTAWSYALLAEHGAPGWVLAMTLGGGAVAAPLTAIAFAEALAREAMTTHAIWQRPTAPLERHAGGSPKVSVHLCCYAEPPEIVIAVLDRLAHLDYPEFEVLVCDNNTRDEALWRPLERHVAHLQRTALPGRSFRFFHVSPLAGAKAGALNWLLDRTAPDAELIAVIDADYTASSDFLSRLTGFFDDPKLGYLQTPHDYRGWQASPYLTACYWEYMPNNKVEMPGVSDYGAGYTIGTMCLIRRSMLEAAGRWAEWCLTEDSEVSVRLRAIGAEGLYLRRTFGRGLIPETFDDYKKQRFRWTAGPVQQLRRHWRLYRPNALGGSVALSGWSKLLEVVRGVAPLGMLGAYALGMGSGLLGAVLIALGEVQPILLPQAAWLAGVLGAAALLLSGWTRYRLADCRSLRAMALGELARVSLSYVQMVAGIAGLSGKPLAWRRTPKFRAEGNGTLRALGSTIPETAIGFAHLVLVAVAVGAGAVLGRDLAVVGTLGLLISAARFFAAPAMALMSERHLVATEGVAEPVTLPAG